MISQGSNLCSKSSKCSKCAWIMKCRSLKNEPHSFINMIVKVIRTTRTCRLIQTISKSFERLVNSVKVLKYCQLNLQWTLHHTLVQHDNVWWDKYRKCLINTIRRTKCDFRVFTQSFKYTRQMIGLINY